MKNLGPFTVSTIRLKTGSLVLLTMLASAGMASAAPTNLVLELNGGYVTVPDSDELSVTDNFTLEAWANSFADDTVTPRAIMSKRRPGLRLATTQNPCNDLA